MTTPLLPTGKLPHDLLSRLLSGLPPDPSVVVGPACGRDVAVLEMGAGRDLLVATADPITFATDALGEYALAVNLNDLATSGGEPRWMLTTLLLPAGSATVESAEQVFRQLRQAAERYGVALVGGHTEVTPAVTQPVVCVALLGTAPRDGYLTAAGVQPGDALLALGAVPVEGTVLLAREHGARLAELGFTAGEIAEAAALLYEPGLCVLPYARLLREAGAEVHALHDPTEGGLATGLWELAGASGVQIEADLERASVLPLARRFCAALGIDWRGLIASGCLLAAVAPEAAARVAACGAERGLPVAQIGQAHKGEGVPGVPLFAQDEITRVPGRSSL
jgi:hydrogenase maturation factor